jgi:galactarate dehydratase
MRENEDHNIIKTSPGDNVGIVSSNDFNIPFGQKVALCGIKEDERIIRYGETIGRAKISFVEGDWVKASDISMPESPDLQSIPLPDARPQDAATLEGYTFQGYRNKDGSVGTRNILGVAASVQCVAPVVDYAVKKIRHELLPRFPNVDDVTALTHTYGCGVAIDAPGAKIPIRTIRNIISNPNFGGEVMVVGLGCEKLPPDQILSSAPAYSGGEKGAGYYASLSLQDKSFRGFEEMVRGILVLAEAQLEILNKRERVSCPASDLVVGIQCGGSDAFSGITANPVAGFAADLIVNAGGSVLFSEVTEVRDAIHLLVPRTIGPEVGQALLDEMRWFDEYLLQGGADRSANTSPGNKEGGLSNIVEKALGSVVKSGTSPIVDVLGPGERIRKKGLTFAATPASDFVCGTLQLAAGMNMHVFTTGRGTPYGLSQVPVIKVGSNSELAGRWFDLIDLDAGQVALGDKSIEEMGWELFRMILDIAGGKKVACDRFGLYNDLVLFNPGPLT